MNVSLTYRESQEFIQRQFNIKPEISMVDDKTVCLSYNPGFFLFIERFLPVVTKVDLHIEAIRDNTIIITYNCGLAMALTVQGAVKLLEDKVPANIMKIDTQTRSIQVFVDEIDQLKKVLKYVKINDVYFDKGKINVDLLLK